MIDEFCSESVIGIEPSCREKVSLSPHLVSALKRKTEAMFRFTITQKAMIDMYNPGWFVR